jgi:hypothetical protein
MQRRSINYTILQHIAELAPVATPQKFCVLTYRYMIALFETSDKVVPRIDQSHGTNYPAPMIVHDSIYNQGAESACKRSKGR